MIEEEGIVVDVEGKTARVAVLRKSACESCAAAGVCHPQDADRSFLVADNPLNAAPGQKVKVLLAPHEYLKKSLFVRYGVPATSFFGGAIIAKELSLRFAGESRSDLWAGIGGALCLVVSFLLLRMYNRKMEKAPNYKPVIVEIIS